ncbi:hypothetical protein [Virgibacillus kimchii]
MIRSFIVLLLFAVFFLSGMLYGVERGIQETPPAVTEESSSESVQDKIAFYEQRDSSVETEDILATTEGKSLTQQTASFLEAGVKGVYDVIVHLLYQFAQLFF